MDGKQSRKVLYTTRIAMTAEFLDFEALAAFLVDWAGRDGLTVGHIAWDVRVENRRSYGWTCVARRSVMLSPKPRPTPTRWAGDGRRGCSRRSGHVGRRRNESVGPMMMRAAGADMGAGPTLELRPDDVVIAAAVDARFTASD